MSVKLDDLDLVKTAQDGPDGPLLEMRTVYDMKISDTRCIVELEIQGSESNVMQDMGCEPLRVSLFGEMMGKDAKQSLEKLRAKYDANKPIPFISDITSIPDVSKVMIEEFYFEEIPGSISRYRYYMQLVEYKEPREPPPQQAPSQAQQAQRAVNNQSEIHDVYGQILYPDGSPAKEVLVKMKGPSGEFEILTNDDGYYEFLEVPEGKYEITVDAEGFEDVKEEVKVPNEDRE